MLYLQVTTSLKSCLQKELESISVLENTVVFVYVQIPRTMWVFYKVHKDAVD